MKNLPFYILAIMAAAVMGALALTAADKPRECEVRSIPQLCNAVQGPNLAPLLPTGFKVIGVADFNGDRYPDLFLYNETTGESFIWYLYPEQLQ